jgi:chromosome segregation ATPase
MNDLEHFVTESNSLKKENINKNNLINELRQENNKLKNIISKLKNELNKKSQTSLMDHPQTRNESIKYSKSTKDNYKINNNYMNEGNSSFSEVVKLKETIKKLQSQIKNNNKIYTEKDVKLNYMKNDSEYKTNEIKDLTEKYKQLYNEFDIKQKENIELTKKMNKSNEQKKGLQKKITNLERENSEYQQQNYELKNQINKLQIRVNSVHSGSINLFGRKDKYQDLEQQIQQLQTKNEELEEKIRGLKQCNENGEKIEKIIEENRKLKKENLDLNNEILTYKNLINENDKENELSNNDNDNDIEDDKNNVNIKKNILENIKAEYGLSEIKNSTVDSNLLGSILKKKSKEDNLLSSNMKASSIYDELDRVKKENSEKDEKIKQLEKEIQKYKWMNNNLVKEKNNLMKKISFFENKTGNKDEELNTYTTKNINRNKVINLKDDSMNKSRNQSNIQGGGDKVQIYKQQIVEYKNMNESDQKQIKTLKTDIKKLNEKLQNMNTFGGQVPNFGEFIQLIYKVFAGFKPKKKEQKDAYEKLLAILKNPIF